MGKDGELVLGYVRGAPGVRAVVSLAPGRGVRPRAARRDDGLGAADGQGMGRVRIGLRHHEYGGSGGWRNSGRLLVLAKTGTTPQRVCSRLADGEARSKRGDSNSDDAGDRWLTRRRRQQGLGVGSKGGGVSVVVEMVAVVVLMVVVVVVLLLTVVAGQARAH